GLALHLQKDLPGAVHAFQEAIELDPKFLDAHSSLGRLFSEQSRFPEAIAEYREVIRLQPDDADAHNMLAYLLCSCVDPKVRDAGRALEHASKAVALGPKVPLYWGNLGIAHYRRGQWQEAVTALQKAEELSKPRAVVTRFVLAMAYWQLGKK